MTEETVKDFFAGLKGQLELVIASNIKYAPHIRISTHEIRLAGAGVR